MFLLTITSVFRLLRRPLLAKPHRYIYAALIGVLTPGLLYCQTVPAQKTKAALDPVVLRKYVQERMAAASIPSIAVAAVRGKQIVWEEAFGLADREQHIPATPHTTFYLASVTKAITGTAVLMLQEHQQIDLDQPVNEYLASAKVHSPMWDATEATVRRVATHTAGLTTYNRKCAVQDTTCQVSTNTAIVRYGILFWPPGEHFDYSNLGYGILGELVSHVSGKSYADFLSDQVFRPLGMRDCFLGVAHPPSSHIAAQYDSVTHARTPVELSDTPGASSAHCSVHDLALLGMFVLGAHLPTQKQILSDASVQMMLKPTVETGDGERYGFGWALQPSRHQYLSVYAQGGTNDSFAVLQMIPSEQIAVAVIANTGTTIPFEIVDKVLSDLLPRYREDLATQPPTPPQSPAPPATTSLVGTWTGHLQTWKGSIPLTLRISGLREVQVQWKNDPWLTATGVDIADPRVYCIVHGQVETPDAPRPPYDLELELYLRGRALVGAATTKDGVQLPYWVQLERARQIHAGHQPSPGKQTTADGRPPQ
ncbi:MAG TPA: serine hydrolase domain-containing protein [Terriglobales bacterium]|nr:serine hydrolase domain-containing protein [Terriglobales bacterium]